MKNCTCPCLLAAVLMVPGFALAQSPATPGRMAQGGPDRATVLKVAREVMQQARYCDMVTIGEDGQPQARVIDAFPPEADMTIWIATNPLSRKVAQIRKDPRVTLLYFSPSAMAYVTVIGRAALVTNPAEKAKRWKEDWAAFYKDRNHGEDYVLIRVTPVRLEIVSYGHGLLNDPASWRPLAVEFP